MPWIHLWYCLVKEQVLGCLSLWATEKTLTLNNFIKWILSSVIGSSRIFASSFLRCFHLICTSTNLYACVLVYSTNVYSFSCMVSVLGNEFINCLFSILFHLCFVLKFMVVFSIINMTQLKLKCWTTNICACFRKINVLELPAWIPLARDQCNIKCSSQSHVISII